MNDKEIDDSVEADAKRMRWMLNGNGYFMEEQSLCGHEPCSKWEMMEARKEIDEAMQRDSESNAEDRRSEAQSQPDPSQPHSKP